MHYKSVGGVFGVLRVIKGGEVAVGEARSVMVIHYNDLMSTSLTVVGQNNDGTPRQSKGQKCRTVPPDGIEPTPSAMGQWFESGLSKLGDPSPVIMVQWQEIHRHHRPVRTRGSHDGRYYLFE